MLPLCKSSRRTSRALAVTAALLLPAATMACGSDDNDTANNAISTVSSVASNAGSTASSALENATDGSTSNKDEGPANEIATAMVAALKALPDGGQPTVANLQAVARSAPSGVAVTGIEDKDNDGKDDDAKATVEANSGKDKACMQQQSGQWEVTDDEC